ncbi:hypothetical protein BC830DRAFT_1098532 [Chytriomyces sp. MP71]|nr:hypothetical protein BC830DRAFT_1098532 [Chytriomyces sp. MP71]
MEEETTHSTTPTTAPPPAAGMGSTESLESLDSDLDAPVDASIDDGGVGGIGAPARRTTATLDDIFGGGDDESELDENENLNFSDSDEEEAPVQLPSFKKKADAVDIPPSAKPPKKSSSKSKKRDAPRDRAEKAEPKDLDPEAATKQQVANDFQEALNRIKNKRAKKLDGDDTELDDLAKNLVDKMKEAALKDVDFNRNGQPAIAKLKLLTLVMGQLSKNHMFTAFLDGGMLDSMKLWLEPLPDGSLPNLDVQMGMFNTLVKLPITTENLRDSKIGRVVMFYTKCDRTTPSALKIANELLEKWMRPILGRSQSYKERGLQTVQFNASEIKKRKINLETNDNDEEKFTRVPKPLLQAFKVMPASNFGSVFKGDKDKDSPNKAKKTKTLLQAFQKKKR